jgi:hypothetical protein
MWGPRICFILGGTGHLIFILCNLLLALRGESNCVVIKDKDVTDNCTGIYNSTFVWIIVISGAICNGVGAALCWSSQGIYLSECATDDT